jgi:hypothetical protein
MKQLIELGAVRIGAANQNVCANVDFDVLSLPGGSLIAVVLWLYAGAASSVKRAITRVRAPRNHSLRRAGLLRQSGAVPLSASSLIACALLDRCAKPMPRNTFGVFENWMLS